MPKTRSGSSRSRSARKSPKRGYAGARSAALRVCTLLRKPDAQGAHVDIAYVGFDIPNDFVVGYGLDYDERYRDLSYIGTLDPRVYQQ